MNNRNQGKMWDRDEERGFISYNESRRNQDRYRENYNPSSYRSGAGRNWIENLEEYADYDNRHRARQYGQSNYQNRNFISNRDYDDYGPSPYVSERGQQNRERSDYDYGRYSRYGSSRSGIGRSLLGGGYYDSNLDRGARYGRNEFDGNRELRNVDDGYYGSSRYSSGRRRSGAENSRSDRNS